MQVYFESLITTYRNICYPWLLHWGKFLVLPTLCTVVIDRGRDFAGAGAGAGVGRNSRGRGRGWDCEIAKAGAGAGAGVGEIPRAGAGSGAGVGRNSRGRGRGRGLLIF